MQWQNNGVEKIKLTKMWNKILGKHIGSAVTLQDTFTMLDGVQISKGTIAVIHHIDNKNQVFYFVQVEDYIFGILPEECE